MKLSIFTPTYNRENFLPGLYKSITDSMKDIAAEDEIEWLIIDDGSKCDLTSTVESFEAKSNLSIVFRKKTNGGKHTAYNHAVDIATGDLFVCIDDDDRITENALKDIFFYAKKFANDGYSAIVGRAVDTEGRLLGNTVFEDYLVSNTIEIRDKYNFWGEPEIYYLDKIKDYRFDVFSGERFLTEAYLFDKITIKYPAVYLNNPIIIKEYHPGGLTDNNVKIRVNSPVGTEAYYYQRKQLCSGFANKLKATINRQRFAFYIKNRPQRPFDIYELIAAPIAVLFQMKDKKTLNSK